MKEAPWRRQQITYSDVCAIAKEEEEEKIKHKCHKEKCDEVKKVTTLVNQIQMTELPQKYFKKIKR